MLKQTATVAVFQETIFIKCHDVHFIMFFVIFLLMEILIINPFFHPYMGGTEKHILYIGRRLAKKHNLTVLTARLKDTPEHETIDGIKVVRSPAKVFYSAPHPLPPPVPIFSGFANYLKKHMKDAQIVHAHNRFAYRVNDMRLVKKSKKNLLLTLHNARPNNIDFLTDTFGSAYDDLFSKKIMRMCDGITAVSRNTMDVTLPEDYKGRLAVIHNGVDETLFKPRTSPGPWPERFRKKGLERRIVLTNVRLIAQKGIPYLIEGMKGLDADLVVFGRGPLKSSLEKMAKREGVNALFVTERITDKELAALYAAADIFVLPSLYEPCAVALLEAMASGKPIVASDAGGNPELVINGKSGLVVPAHASYGIRNAVKKLLGDEKLARKFGRNIRKRVLDNFTWDIAAKKFDSFYQKF